MAIDFDGDLLNMFSTDEFGVTATINGNPVNGIYDATYFEVADGDVILESSQPAFLCRTVDVPSAKHGDIVAIGSDSFLAVGIQPDGTGVTVIQLEKQ